MTKILVIFIITLSLISAAPASAGFSDGGDSPSDICNTLWEPRPPWCPPVTS